MTVSTISPDAYGVVIFFGCISTAMVVIGLLGGVKSNAKEAEKYDLEQNKD